MFNETLPRIAIGIDVGGTKCAGGLVYLYNGNVLDRHERPTKSERGGEPVLADVIELALAMKAAAERLRVSPLAIGIGVCELVNSTGQIVSDATVRWKGIPVGTQVSQQTKLPVVVEADVRAAALGEAYFGAGQQYHSFLYVTVGTGISSALVLNRRPYVGARGLTGTFASSRQLIPNDEGMLVSGPALEEFSSGPALVARLAAFQPGFEGVTADVVALAESGDVMAQNIVDSAGAALGAALAHLVNVLDPQAVVIGGGLGLVEGRFRRSLRDAFHSHLWSDLHQDVPLLSARLGKDAGMVGAALASARTEGAVPC